MIHASGVEGRLAPWALTTATNIFVNRKLVPAGAA